MTDNDMVQAIKSILEMIQKAIVDKRSLFWFDITSPTPLAAAGALQRVLISKGFITLISISNLESVRVYIDIKRSMAKVEA